MRSSPTQTNNVGTEAVVPKAIGSVKWSALMEIVSRTASPIICVVLARLLTPADFGVVATAMIVISFSQMFWDAGLSKALIQTKESPDGAAHVVFWTNIVLGALIYIILFFTAPAIAMFFRSPASEPVLRVLGLQIVIASFTSVQSALFIRDLNFRSLFWIRLLTAFMPGLFSIPMAFFGCGVWALVTGTIAGQLLNLYLLWSRSPWRPKLTYNMALAGRLFHFGFWVLLESFGAWLIVWGDNLIVGRFLGVHDLGMYRTGWILVTTVFGLSLNPFLVVLYPTFSRLQDNPPALIAAFYKVNRIVMAVALPIGVGLLVGGPEVASMLFGDKWQGLGFVLAVLGVMQGMAWVVGINPELYRAIGRPDVNTKLMYVQLLYYLPAYYIAAQHGLAVFTMTRLAVAAIATPIHIWLCVKMLHVSPAYLWQNGKTMIASVLMMAVSTAFLKWNILPAIHLSSSPFVTSTATAISGFLIYIACLWFLDRPFVIQTRNLIKRAALT